MGVVLEIAAEVVVFFAGAFAGNFYHLVVRRRPAGGFTVVLPPACVSCGRAERRIWMLPFLWFAILRGRCPRCGYPFPRRLLIYEAAAGGCAALFFYYYGPTVKFVTTFGLFYFFLLNYVVEFRYMVLVPQLYIPATALGFGASFLPGGISPYSSGAAFAVAAIPAWVFRRYEREGGGAQALSRALFLAGLAGTFLGWQAVVMALAAAAAVTFIWGAVGRRLVRGDAAGVFVFALLPIILILAVYREDILGWYFRFR